MAGCGNDFRSRFVAAVAGEGHFAFLCAGCRLGDFAVFPIVTQCRNFFLCDKHCITYGAVAARRLAGFGAGCINCRIRNDRMAGCGNCFCSDFAAAHAGEDLFAVFRAGCSLVNFAGIPIMTQCRNLFLCNQNLAAIGAVAAFGQAGCNTGRRYSLINYCIVFGYRNYFLLNKHCVTYGAMTALGQAGRGAGRCNCRIRNDRVAGCGNRFCSGFVAAVAGEGLYTFLRAGCSRCDCAVVPIVTQCRNFFLRNDHCITYGAMTAFGLAGCGASRCNCRIRNDCMAGCGNGFRSGFVAAFAGEGLYAVLRAGCGRSDCAVVPIVTQCRNLFLCSKHCITYGAVAALGLAGCGAGRCNCRVGNHGMVNLCNHFCSGFAATGAGIGLDAFRNTGRRLCNCAIVPCVRADRSIGIIAIFGSGFYLARTAGCDLIFAPIAPVAPLFIGELFAIVCVASCIDRHIEV